MNISRLGEKKYIRLFLIVSLLSLQSCSNTLIGEKLENSFNTTQDLQTSGKTNKKSQKLNEKTNLKTILKEDKKRNENNLSRILKENPISNEERQSQKSTKLINKTIFNPKPYRIILRLSGANPSAPAETVTEALRKAGVQFEVEKIERFDANNFSKYTPSKR